MPVFALLIDRSALSCKIVRTSTLYYCTHSRTIVHINAHFYTILNDFARFSSITAAVKEFATARKRSKKTSGGDSQKSDEEAMV